MSEKKSYALLLLGAFIWGCAFVAQSVAMDAIGPWTFTCARSFLAAVVLFPIATALNRKNGCGSCTGEEKKELLKAGLFCGLALTAGSMFQQAGIQYTTVSKAGFITSLYVVMVPIFARLIGKRVRALVWVCAFMSAIGLYLLSMQGGFYLEFGDMLVFLCAISFAVHILTVDHFSGKVNGLRLSNLQFLVVGLVCLFPALLLEHPHWADLKQAMIPILYAGILSSGAGYTLQIVAQKNADPTIASMIMSLESVFAALAGFVLLHQSMSIRELIGAGIMFAAILLSQLPELPRK